jgi:hypothetical protein
MEEQTKLVGVWVLSEAASAAFAASLLVAPEPCEELRAAAGRYAAARRVAERGASDVGHGV